MRLEGSSPAANEGSTAGRWSHWPTVVAVLWVTMVTVCCLRSGLSEKPRSVFPIFANAAQSWLAGTELYITGGPVYRYSPLVTVLLVPFGVLPYSVGVVLWQLLNAVVLLAGLWAWCRHVLPAGLSQGRLATFFVLVLPFVAANINNGQSNCLLLGLMLLAVAGVVAQRWTATAVCLTLATLLKLYPLALVLLLVGLQPRRLGWRCAALLALGLALPFCCQRPEYVASQYASWFQELRTEDRATLPIEAMYRDVRLLLRAAGGELSNTAYLLLQVVSGSALFGLGVLARRRGLTPPQLHGWLFGLTCCWMTVCGTATEACTYMLVAPALAWGLIDPRQGRVQWLARGLILGSAVLLTLTMVVAWWEGGNRWHALGMHPLGGLLLAAGLVVAEVPGLWFGVREGRLTTVPVARSPARAA